MLIVLEGIDGAGKSTIAESLFSRLRATHCGAEFHTKKTPASLGEYFDANVRSLRELVWPSDDGSRHHEMGDLYWLYLVASWFALVAKTITEGDSADLILYDHWFYRFICKFTTKGYDRGWLFTLFADVPKPDLVVFLDSDPAHCWDRRSFKLPEMGSHDGYETVGRESYIDHQTRVRRELLDLAADLDWHVIANCHDLSVETVATEISEIVESKIGLEEKIQ